LFFASNTEKDEKADAKKVTRFRKK